MEYRKFGRTGWNVSEIGYGMFGLAEWTGGNELEIEQSLHLAVASGCNFFDTAWAYGNGKSETILGKLIKSYPEKTLYIASKIPPKDFNWPAKKGSPISDYLPAAHIRDYTEKSLANLKAERINLMQFHLWEDTWGKDESWQRVVEDLKKEGKIEAVGISVNRWEPENVLETLKTNHIDAVQVMYNLFEQAPEDELFPLCRELNMGVIARVPFDEGILTGTFTRDTKFPADDWRSNLFTPENLENSLNRIDKLKEDVPAGMNLAELALRFILNNSDVHTTIPGMRRPANVSRNVAVSDGEKLPDVLVNKLKEHRWDRKRWWDFSIAIK